MNINHFDFDGRERRGAALRTAISDGPEDEGLNERRGNLSHDLSTNHPPSEIAKVDDSPLGFAKVSLGLMETFMNDTPVIENGVQAAAAKTQIETARGALAEMEKERDGKVRPLNDQVDEINGRYSAVSKPFKRVVEEVKARLTAYAKKEEKRREAIAAEAKRIADEKLAAAVEAERLEQEAIANAAAGELDVDVAAKIERTDETIREAKVAIRQANVAERDTTFRAGGGTPGSRSMGMRTNTTLTLVDPIRAIVAMGGVSEKTREAILTDARTYKKLKGEYPSGVTAEESRGF